MALKDLSIETMVACSGAWLDADHERPLIEKYPLLKAMLPKIQSVHDALLLAKSSDALTDGAVEHNRLNEAILGADEDFDRLARGLGRLLGGLAEVASEPAQREFWRATRVLVFPSGMNIVSLPYLEEVEAVESVQRRLDASLLERFEHTPVGESNLRAIYEAWVDASQRLGHLVNQRDAIELGAALAQGEPDEADAFRVRSGWIRMVRTLRDSMMIEGVDEATRQALLGPLKS